MRLQECVSFSQDKMAKAKDIIVKTIRSSAANEIVRKIHYSHSVVNNSQLHFGVYINNMLCGAMQFGPPMTKTKSIGLITGTKWNGFLELNRMAFGPELPKNSESRALGYALRAIKKHYPNIEWIQTFADATQCGDGTIYRACGFVLTQIKRNTSILKMADGKIVTNMTIGKGQSALNNGGRAPKGTTPLKGFQIRYIYFLNPEARKRLTVAEIPYSKIKEFGASMYLGKTRASSVESGTSEFHSEGGGESPTDALQLNEIQLKT